MVLLLPTHPNSSDSFDYYLDENTILDIFNSLNQKGITIGGFVGNDLSFDYINNFKFGLIYFIN